MSQQSVALHFVFGRLQVALHAGGLLPTSQNGVPPEHASLQRPQF
jgi:hypothetical protein